jgi:hypothetical protein
VNKLLSPTEENMSLKIANIHAVFLLDHVLFPLACGFQVGQVDLVALDRGRFIGVEFDVVDVVKGLVDKLVVVDSPVEGVSVFMFIKTSAFAVPDLDHKGVV